MSRPETFEDLRPEQQKGSSLVVLMDANTLVTFPTLMARYAHLLEIASTTPGVVVNGGSIQREPDAEERDRLLGNAQRAWDRLEDMLTRAQRGESMDAGQRWEIEGHARNEGLGKPTWDKESGLMTNSEEVRP